ncbi:MAG: ABC transporter permease [Bacteroidia bacterium]
MRNFIYSFQSEWLKKKRSLASILVVAGAFFIPAVILVAKLVRHSALSKASISARYWENLWNDALEPMAVFLLPLGIALAASLITQLEFKNNTWKQLHTTPQTLTTIFFAKLTVILVMLVQFFILFNIGIYLSGIIPNLVFGIAYPTEPIPWLFFVKENFHYFIDCLPVLALQYLISLQFKNFLVPVAFGIACWILSIAVLGWEYGHWIPYSYCGLNYLHGVGKYNRETPIHVLALGYFLVFTIISYILYVNKKEKG